MPPVPLELFEQVTSAEEAALDRTAKAEAFQASGGMMASRIQVKGKEMRSLCLFFYLNP